MHSPQGLGRVTTVAAVVVAALASAALVAGCTHKSAGALTSPSPAGPSASAMPSVDPSVAAAKAAAMEAYQGYFAAYARAAAVANPDDPNLATYINGPLLINSQHNLFELKNHGAIELGSPRSTITDATVDLAAKPPAVTLQTCADYSDWRLVYKNNQSPVPNSSLKVPRYTTTATVNLFVGGKWMVAQDIPHRNTPC